MAITGMRLSCRPDDQFNGYRQTAYIQQFCHLMPYHVVVELQHGDTFKRSEGL